MRRFNIQLATAVLLSVAGVAFFTQKQKKMTQNNRVMLSKHFSLEELTYSRVAIDNGLDNTPTPEALENLKQLTQHLLQPLRDAYGLPLHVNSGYRSPELNRLVGGTRNSQHMQGQAVDLYTPSPAAILELIKRHDWIFDQLIIYRRRKFIHLSFKPTGRNRKQVIFNSTYYKYQ